MNHVDPAILTVLSIGVFGGMIGGWFFQRLKIPQVVGYIAIGLLVGETGFGFIQTANIEQLKLFNFFALGIIGFLVGGELKLDVFRKYGKQFTAILLGEGIAAFLLVSVASTIIIYFVYPHFCSALAGGVVLGAIASATDPASTIDVLWEYRSKGILTTSIIAIVALDDALAMTLYGLGTSCSLLLAGGTSDIVGQLWKIGIGLGGALVLGGIAACLLAVLLRLMDKVEKGVALSIGVILLVISASIAFEMDVILASMTLGFVLTNVAPRRSKKIFELLRSFSIPIYVVFFVLVGARLQLGGMPMWIWGIVLVYVIGRSVGKVVGSWVGAKLSSSPPQVRKYLGSSLFAQGGVAIGLSIMAGQNLSSVMITETVSLGAAVITIVTTTTLIVQIIGPAMVKFSIKKAGEMGMDRTESDVLRATFVKQVMNADVITIQENLPLGNVIKNFQTSDQFVFPVVNDVQVLRGTLTLQNIREIISSPNEWQWLIAADVMQPVADYCNDDDMVYGAHKILIKTNQDQMPVLDDERIVIGLLDRRLVRQFAQKTILKEPPLTSRV